MTTRYISPKLMAELKDRAVRVKAGDGGALVWVAAAQEWFLVDRWQAPHMGPDFTVPSVDPSAEEVQDALRASMQLTARRIKDAFLLPTRGSVHIPPPPALVEELERIDREKEDGERLKVLGRLFEKLRRGDGVDLYVMPATETPLSEGGQGSVAWIRYQAQRTGSDRSLRLSAEELEAVEGIR